MLLFCLYLTCTCYFAAYISLVRSTLEYGTIIWDPYAQGDIDRLEKIQRKGARFIKNDYKSRDSGCVTRMLKELDIISLQERRKELRLLFLCKVVEGLVPAIPVNSFVEPARPQRRIAAKRFSDFESKNPVEAQQKNNSNCFKVITSKTNIYKYSFFPRTVIDWNQQSDTTISALKAKCTPAKLHQ